MFPVLEVAPEGADPVLRLDALYEAAERLRSPVLYLQASLALLRCARRLGLSTRAVEARAQRARRRAIPEARASSTLLALSEAIADFRSVEDHWLPGAIYGTPKRRVSALMQAGRWATARAAAEASGADRGVLLRLTRVGYAADGRARPRFVGRLSQAGDACRYPRSLSLLAGIGERVLAGAQLDPAAKGIAKEIFSKLPGPERARWGSPWALAQRQEGAALMKLQEGRVHPRIGALLAERGSVLAQVVDAMDCNAMVLKRRLRGFEEAAWTAVFIQRCETLGGRAAELDGRPRTEGCFAALAAGHREALRAIARFGDRRAARSLAKQARGRDDPELGRALGQMLGESQWLELDLVREVQGQPASTPKMLRLMKRTPRSFLERLQTDPQALLTLAWRYPASLGAGVQSWPLTRVRRALHSWKEAPEIDERLLGRVCRTLKVKDAARSFLQWRWPGVPADGVLPGQLLRLRVLDRRRDLLTWFRFADLLPCCYRSTARGYTYSVGQPAICDLWWDPLSFVAHIERPVGEGWAPVGFVFGGMAEAGGRALWVNGVYLPRRILNQRRDVLDTIEQGLAAPLGITTIAVAARHGGRGPLPEDYRPEALVHRRYRPLKRRGGLCTWAWDDFGEVVNLRTIEEVYVKRR